MKEIILLFNYTEITNAGFLPYGYIVTTGGGLDYYIIIT